MKPPAMVVTSKRKPAPKNQEHVLEKSNAPRMRIASKPTEASKVAYAKKNQPAVEEQVYEEPTEKAPLQGKSDDDSQDEITLGGPGEDDEAEGEEDEDEDSPQE